MPQCKVFINVELYANILRASLTLGRLNVQRIMKNQPFAFCFGVIVIAFSSIVCLMVHSQWMSLASFVGSLFSGALSWILFSFT